MNEQLDNAEKLNADAAEAIKTNGNGHDARMHCIELSKDLRGDVAAAEKALIDASNVEIFQRFAGIADATWAALDRHAAGGKRRAAGVALRPPAPKR